MKAKSTASVQRGKVTHSVVFAFHADSVGVYNLAPAFYHLHASLHCLTLLVSCDNRSQTLPVIRLRGADSDCSMPMTDCKRAFKLKTVLEQTHEVFNSQ